MPSFLRSGKEFRLYEPVTIPSCSPQILKQLASVSLPHDVDETDLDIEPSPNACLDEPYHSVHSLPEQGVVGSSSSSAIPSTQLPPGPSFPTPDPCPNSNAFPIPRITYLTAHDHNPHTYPSHDSPRFHPYPPQKQPHQHRKRAKKRAEQKAQRRPIEQGLVHRHVIPATEQPALSPFTVERFIQCVQTNGYRGKRPLGLDMPELQSVEEAVQRGFTVIEWNGSHDKPICLSDTQVVCALAGIPNDATYRADIQQAYDLAMALQQHFKPPHSTGTNCRGPHLLLNFGILHGNGSQEPHNMGTHGNDGIVQELRAARPFRRMAAFTNSVLKMWFPRLYDLYDRNLRGIMQVHPDLTPSFPNSVFPMSCLNFGPSVVTKKHRDVQNFPFGVCAVQALGNFDYKRGGHLVLWELGLVVEFPPGATILLPSAVITHSNIPISPSEQRASLVHYAPGSLFQYADYGYQTKTKLGQELEGVRAFLDEKRKANWKDGITYYSLLRHLQDEADYKEVGLYECDVSQ